MRKETHSIRVIDPDRGQTVQIEISRSVPGGSEVSIQFGGHFGLNLDQQSAGLFCAALQKMVSNKEDDNVKK